MSDQTTPAVVEQKTIKPWQSKTLWINLFIAIAAFFPFVRDWVAANPGIFMAVVTTVFSVLRVVTKGNVEIG